MKTFEHGNTLFCHIKYVNSIFDILWIDNKFLFSFWSVAYSHHV